MVPSSGNVWIGGQQVWLGPALSGRQITFWADAISLHVLRMVPGSRPCPPSSEPLSWPGWPLTAHVPQVRRRCLPGIAR